MHASLRLPARLLLAALLLGACAESSTAPGAGPGTEQPGPVPVAAVRITPGDLALTVGQPARLSAVALAADDTPLAGRSVTWTSETPAVAAVNADGTVSPLQAGTAAIVATVEGRSARIAVRVSAPVPVPRTVLISRADLSVLVGDTVVLTARVLDGEGREMADVPVYWASGDARYASIDGEGRVIARGAGTTRLLATVRAGEGTLTTAIAVTVGHAQVAGRWMLSVGDIMNANTRCWVERALVTLTQQGDSLHGEAGGYDGGPGVGCAPLPGTQGPFTSPMTPGGEVRGAVNGRRFELRIGQYWILTGTVSSNSITGRAEYLDYDAVPRAEPGSEVIVPVRVGRLVMVRR